MSVEPRPTDIVTKENVFIGLPVVLFERLLSPGVYDVPRNVGILDSAELQKVVEVATLTDKSSGLSTIVRESVRVLEPSLQLGLFNLEPANMRFFLSSATLVEVTAGTVTVTNDEVTVPNDFDKFAVLSNRNLITDPLTSLDCKEITLETVGTGQGGTFGETLGDFALDFKIELLADVTSFLVGGVERVGQLEDAGSPTTPDDIAIIVGVGATGGQLDFGANETPAAGAAVVATYEPSFSFVNLTDYILDPFEGRIRIIGTGTGKVKAGQTLIADYDYNQPTETQLAPFTQPNFEGRCTIKQLTDDMGINFIWDVPVVSIRVNDEAFAWSPEEFAAASLTITFLKDQTAPLLPFGLFRQFPEQ